jgi:hypothetical protein
MTARDARTNSIRSCDFHLKISMLGHQADSLNPQLARLINLTF